MQIIITIDGSPEELSDFCEKRGIDLKSLTKNIEATLGQTDKDEPNYKKIKKAFRKMSWESVYLAHLILINAGSDQEDEFGYYLNLEQLEKYGLTERKVASRVGGAKRVGKRLNINYILFARKRRDGTGKDYYLSKEYISSLLRYIEKKDFEYREYLEENNLEYPKNI